eukprot:scaffold5391_cov171-Amphora_coffeaeformis.AAC.4
MKKSSLERWRQIILVTRSRGLAKRHSNNYRQCFDQLVELRSRIRLPKLSDSIVCNIDTPTERTEMNRAPNEPSFLCRQNIDSHQSLYTGTAAPRSAVKQPRGVAVLLSEQKNRISSFLSSHVFNDT